MTLYFTIKFQQHAKMMVKMWSLHVTVKLENEANKYGYVSPIDVCGSAVGLFSWIV